MAPASCKGLLAETGKGLGRPPPGLFQAESLWRRVSEELCVAFTFRVVRSSLAAWLWRSEAGSTLAELKRFS